MNGAAPFIRSMLSATPPGAKTHARRRRNSPQQITCEIPASLRIYMRTLAGTRSAGWHSSSVCKMML